MINLKPIPDEPLKVYDAIVGKKKPKKTRRVRLEELRPRIEGAYAEYDRVKPALEQIKALTLQEQEKEDLLHCYQGSTRKSKSSSPRDRLYADVRALVHKCPYCTADTVATLDHYLPKESYPEFCILTLNLIPSCSGCNTPRDFKTPTGDRAMVHPYFDVISRDRLLIATVHTHRGLPEAEFSVDVTNARDRAFADLYSRHFDSLSLKERYGRAAVDELAGMVRSVRVWSRGLGRGDVQARLIEQADADEQVLGGNDFKVALVRGAASSGEFLDYCLGGAS